MSLTIPLSNSYAQNFKFIFHWETKKTKVKGSDNFPMTWAKNGNQYTTWGDGWGFNSPIKQSLGISEIKGDNKDNFLGQDIAYGIGKSYGIVDIDGRLFIWVVKDAMNDLYPQSTLYFTDNYKDFHRSVIFSKDEKVVSPKIVQYERGYSGSFDDYVYHYFIELNASPFTIQKPGKLYCFRVKKNEMLEKSKYQFFAQGNWVEDRRLATPILENDDGFGLDCSIVFNSGLKTFFLLIEHHESFVGNLAIYSSKYPWGPWIKELYEFSWGPNSNYFYWNFSNKWTSANGKKTTMVFSGIGENDAMNLIDVDIIPKKKNLHFLNLLLN